MTHIGIDARLTHYRLGGISTYTRQLITALESLNTNQQFTAFTSRKASIPLDTTFNQAKLWTPPHHRLERIALSAELIRHGLDIFHATDFIPPQFGAKKHVITIHDLTFLHYPQHKDQSAIRYYNDQIEYAVRRSDHILAVSSATKNDLMTMLNVPDKKITVQPHGVNPRFHPIQHDELEQQRKKVNLPEKYILTVGTLEPRKNIPTLLSAYEALPQAIRDNYALVLVGQLGWLFDETMQQIKQLQERGLNIIIRSDISDEQLPFVYNLASVFVLPSFYEGFGMPILEAMACGIPVIASNTSSLPEVIGEAGILISPENHEELTHMIAHVLNHDEQRQHLIQAGLEHVKLFTWEKSAKIALSVYTALG